MTPIPATDATRALVVAERIRTGVARSPVSYDGQDLRVTIGLGTASLDAGCACEAEDLLRAADHALYRAKAAGRNCVREAIQEDWR